MHFHYGVKQQSGFQALLSASLKTSAGVPNSAGMMGGMVKLGIWLAVMAVVGGRLRSDFARRRSPTGWAWFTRSPWQM
jgi:hypothetical protein